MSKRENVAAKSLLKSMGENPRGLVPDSLVIQGREVEWTKSCNNTGNCLHARFGMASAEALDAYFEAVTA